MAHMSEGWYPDPAGAPSMLRFWDGSEWTDRVMDADVRTRERDAVVAEAVAVVLGSAKASANGVKGAKVAASHKADQVPSHKTVPYNVEVNVIDSNIKEKEKERFERDCKLFLIAFIFALISTILMAPFVIPLCWMIPMTVRCWRIYSIKDLNTVTFGVCSLFFLNPITGILLLVCEKD